MPPNPDLSLIVFNARTGDRNSRGMAGAAVIGQALSTQLGIPATLLGKPEIPLHTDWQHELEDAQPALQILAQTCAKIFNVSRVPLIAMGRCATALATLPVLAHNHPDVIVVWFDAHADAHTPATSTSGYLGGMVLAGATGLWDSGLGNGLAWSNIVLVGVRDVDPAEQAMIDDGILQVVPPGENLISELRTAIGNRPVYIHIDCDVLEPGILPTEYRVADGLTLYDLRACSEVLAQNEILGIEIAEFEASWVETGEVASPDGFLDALQPLFALRVRHL